MMNVYWLQDETDVIFHLRAYETRSVLLKHVNPDLMFSIIENQLIDGIPGILQVGRGIDGSTFDQIDRLVID
jgi:hypothetical protein